MVRAATADSFRPCCNGTLHLGAEFRSDVTVAVAVLGYSGHHQLGMPKRYPVTFRLSGLGISGLETL
jgi:hypothetical protein